MGTKLKRYGGANCEVIDFSHYRKHTTVKKSRRKRAPKMEVLCCGTCGGTDFKFVLKSDIEQHGNKVICVGCHTPATQHVVEAIADIVTRLVQ